jgi:hypothetical protein
MTGYFRYADDILILYNNMHTDIEHMLIDFNNLHKNLQFTTEKENNTINFLAPTIHRGDIKLRYNIYQKPSSTIHHTSCHPTEHQIATFNYLFH